MFLVPPTACHSAVAAFALQVGVLLATSQGLRPTGFLVLSMVRTPTMAQATTRATAAAATKDTAAVATRAMAAVATLVVEWQVTFQALRPTGSLVLSMARTPTPTALATKVCTASSVLMYFTCILRHSTVVYAFLHCCMCLCIGEVVHLRCAGIHVCLFVQTYNQIQTGHHPIFWLLCGCSVSHI